MTPQSFTVSPDSAMGSLARRSIPANKKMDLDMQIQAAERAVIECDKRVAKGMRQLVVRAREHAAQQISVGLAVAAGALLFSRLLPRGRGGDSASVASPYPPSGGFSWASLMPLLWSMLPGGIQGAIPKGVPDVLFGRVLPALGQVFRRRKGPQLGKPIGRERRRSVVESAVQVDLERYLGLWYEIARLPSRFEKRCARSVRASYGSMGSHGKLSVLNQCENGADRTLSVRGVARVIKGYGNARLKVSFAPRLLRWLPWVWGNYWILNVAQDYQYALVGTPDRKHLWILSRTPNLSDSVLDLLITRANDQGFSTANLRLTPQPYQ